MAFRALYRETMVKLSNVHSSKDNRDTTANFYVYALSQSQLVPPDVLRAARQDPQAPSIYHLSLS